ncbi:hypothetical protein LPJ53_002106 [Coemansia erecta]|uniref:START domain-containing protein n=1 Tax=Coemansia erecta TaxID=147472 RepID=A0A9W8CU59_9FUNG|nr:hypothetical protein LPJ53_002106 [Coemansia erecta]
MQSSSNTSAAQSGFSEHRAVANDIIYVDALQYPLDRLHYSLFQLLFCVLVPAALNVVKGPQKPAVLSQGTPKSQGALMRDKMHLQDQTLQPQTTEQSAAGPSEPTAPHKYTAKCAELEKTFLQLATQDDSNAASSPWIPLTTVSKPYSIAVQGHVSKPFCFRITFYAPTTPATAFDLLADVLRRPEWDELTETTKIIEKLGQGDAIHYVKAKAIWPTASRDSLLLSHITSVDINGTAAHDRSKRAYMNVSQSIVDDRVPERDAEGIVRMEAGIAGQLITQATSADKARLGLEGEQWCRVVQIADGDLKGWIPKSVIKFIATQALPRSLTKVCQQLALLPPSLDSQLVCRMNAQPGMAAPLPALPETVEKKRAEVQRPASSLSAATSGLRMVRSAGSRNRWLVWIKIILKYAAPSIIAAITSVIVSLIIQRRWKIK